MTRADICTHREEEDAPNEGEQVEGDAPALGVADGADQVVHARLAEQRQRLEDAEHDHQIVDAVAVGPRAQHHRRPQHRHHRERHEHDLHAREDARQYADQMHIETVAGTDNGSLLLRYHGFQRRCTQR